MKNVVVYAKGATVVVIDPPPPVEPPPSQSGVTWSVPNPVDSLLSSPGQVVTLATGVPSDAVISVTPELLPGQSLLNKDGVLLLTNGQDVMTIAHDAPSGSVLDLTGRQAQRTDPGWRIEVLESPLARARNLRFPLEWWGAGESNELIYGLYGGRAHLPNVLSTEYGPMRCRPGDLIEISPGAVSAGAATGQDGDTAYMHVNCSLTIRNIAGRGRWSLLPKGTAHAWNPHGILVHRPIAAYNQERINLLVEGGHIEGYGGGACGIRLRQESTAFSGSWSIYPASLTVRNVKAGQSYHPLYGGSVISGAAEYITIEDSDISDGGNGTGTEHNVYISAKKIVAKGSRFARTRGYLEVPPHDYYSSLSKLEGHIFKVSAIEGVIEGCLIDCVELGDQSELIQMKAGGNWVITDNLIVDSRYPNNANGAMTMCRENAHVSPPNFEPWAGSNGNSILFERNVYVGHYPRPIFWFFPQTTAQTMRPAVGGDWLPEQRLQSFIVRDNTAMVVNEPRPWMLAGWPGVDNAMWINNDPNAGPTWQARGNRVLTYSRDVAAGLSQKARELYYSRANAKSQFLWPHGMLGGA